MTGYTVHNEGYEPEETEEKYSVYNKGFDPQQVDNKTITLTVDKNGIAQQKKLEAGDIDDEEEERGGWGNKLEFVLAIVGYAVGLGNVWRFPYLAQKNGGGAFLIPYILSLAFMGIPIFYMELAIGQRLRRGPLHVWNKLSPLLSGVGLSSVVVSFLVGCYYNMIVAWCFYYLFISFQKNVPYVKCPCIEGIACNETYGIVPECAASSPTTYYWYRGALNTTESIDDAGVFNWKLALCLMLAWALIYVITCKGAESMGKAVYFTAIFPYVVLVIFFVRTLMLDGAADGIKHMFTPEFEKLGKAEVWLDASTQIFYSLGLSFGGLISMASYNPINNNIVRDALLVSVVNCGTSVFAGVVIFGILGYKATINYNKCIDMQVMNNATSCDLKEFLDDVAKGPGLTFIAFTEAMSTMEVTQLWSVMFFMMLLTLGVGTMLGTFEAVRTTVIDLKIIPLRKELVSLLLCVLSYGFGLLFCQGSGQYWLVMFDSFAANIGLLTIALFANIIIMYVYGIKRFELDIEFMLGKKPGLYWKVMWMFFTPVLTFVIIIASFYGLAADGITYLRWDPITGKTFDDDFPDWAKALCIILIVASVIFIPITALLVKYDLFKLPATKQTKADLAVEMQAANGNKKVAKSISTIPLTQD